MLDWFKSHVFIAAWLSPTIALIALIWKKSDPTNPLNWGAVVLYVGFLSSLAALLTPGLDQVSRFTLSTVALLSLGAIMVQAGRHR